MPANLENSAVAIGLKSSFFILIPNKGSAKGKDESTSKTDNAAVQTDNAAVHITKYFPQRPLWHSCPWFPQSTAARSVILNTMKNDMLRLEIARPV